MQEQKSQWSGRPQEGQRGWEDHHFTQQDTDHRLFRNHASPQAVTNDFSGLSFLDDNFEWLSRQHGIVSQIHLDMLGMKNGEFLNC